LTIGTPRRTQDGMANRDDPAKSKPPEREAKLAQALRANLRRRKAGSEPKASDQPKKAD
jgi:hypothetical protein